MKTLIWAVALGAFAAGCSSSDPETTSRTREEFCRDWAEAACSEEAVSACQTNAEACHLTQQRYCQLLVPMEFSDAHGDACIAAVGAAYADGDLTGTELSTVLQLGPPCDAVVRGLRGKGEPCVEDRDCDVSNGVHCVWHGQQPMGTCQVPEVVAPGNDCDAPQESCEAGYYCNGANCISTKEVGEPCVNDAECGADGRCAASSCVARLAVGISCSQDADCTSNLCYALSGGNVCVDRIRLSPAEPLCENLR